MVKKDSPSKEKQQPETSFLGVPVLMDRDGGCDLVVGHGGGKLGHVLLDDTSNEDLHDLPDGYDESGDQELNDLQDGDGESVEDLPDGDGDSTEDDGTEDRTGEDVYAQTMRMLGLLEPSKRLRKEVEPSLCPLPTQPAYFVDVIESLTEPPINPMQQNKLVRLNAIKAKRVANKKKSGVKKIKLATFARRHDGDLATVSRRRRPYRRWQWW